MDLKNVERTIEVSDLIANYLHGTINEAGQEELFQWIHESEQNRNLFERICNERNLVNAYTLFNSFDHDAALNAVKDKPGFNDQVSPIRRKLWTRIAVAAAAVTAIVLSIWIYTSRNINSSNNPELVSGSQDITPGKNRATLSFNGRSMQLSDAKTGVKFDEDKLTYNDGSSLLESDLSLWQEEHSMVTATTPRGGTYEFVLQDGTRVWLNADSKLEFYPSYKNKSQRVVRLEGEGYFEVAKDKAHPFIVESAGQKVEVLGTHFNVNTYKDDGGIKTTLLEGSVNVNGIILKPNQQSTILSTGKVNVGAASPNATAWVNGKFQFENTSLAEVMLQVSRWYDVDVVYPDGIPDERFTGGINRNLNASEVLGMLERMHVKFKLEGKKLIVNK